MRLKCPPTVPIRPALVEEITLRVIVPQPGAYDVVCRVWPDAAVPPADAFLEPLTGKYVSWLVLDAVTGEECIYRTPVAIRTGRAGSV